MAISTCKTHVVTHQDPRGEPGPQKADVLSGAGEDVSAAPTGKEHAVGFKSSMPLLSLCQLPALVMQGSSRICESATPPDTQDRVGHGEVSSPHLAILHMAYLVSIEWLFLGKQNSGRV